MTGGSSKRLWHAESVKRELDRYVTSLVNVVGGNLRGVYVCGSWARECHNPATSDMDMLVVVEGSLADRTQEAVLRIHRAVQIPIDAVFVTPDQLNADLYPTPVEFLVKPMEGGKLVRLPEGSRDFLLLREDAREVGVALFGPAIQTLTRPVPWPLLAQALDFLFPHIVPRFKNPLLMLCRIAYAHKHHRLCSKKQAGEWAMEEFGNDWREAIGKALREYAMPDGSARVTADTLRDFERHCDEYIRGLGAAL
jgi:predicted nucleotidyltransferase